MAAKRSGGSGSGGSRPKGGNRVETTPNPNGSGWVNTLNGEQVSKHIKKEPAVDKGRSIAIDNAAEHTIKKQDGTIQKKNSYGNDPNPPKDKNN